MAPSSLGFPGSSLPIKSLPSLPSSSHLGPCHLLLCSFILCTLYSLPGCLHGHPLSSAPATPCAGESACGPDLPDTHTHLPPSPNVQDFPAAITSPNASTFIFPPSAYWHPTSHHKIGMSSLLSLASSLSRSSLSGPLTHPVNTYLFPRSSPPLAYAVISSCLDLVVPSVLSLVLFCQYSPSLFPKGSPKTHINSSPSGYAHPFNHGGGSASIVLSPSLASHLDAVAMLNDIVTPQHVPYQFCDICSCGPPSNRPFPPLYPAASPGHTHSLL